MTQALTFSTILTWMSSAMSYISLTASYSRKNINLNRVLQSYWHLSWSHTRWTGTLSLFASKIETMSQLETTGTWKIMHSQLLASRIVLIRQPTAIGAGPKTISTAGCLITRLILRIKRHTSRATSLRIIRLSMSILISATKQTTFRRWRLRTATRWPWIGPSAIKTCCNSKKLNSNCPDFILTTIQLEIIAEWLSSSISR